MRITIVGGSRGTGALLAEAAARAGHEVTVLSRSGSGPDVATRVAGDATDPAVVRRAVEGADAVVVTVGAAKGVRHQRTAVTRAVVAAMQEQGQEQKHGQGPRRLLVQSSLGAGDSARQLPAALRPVMKVLLARPLADHDEQEAAVMGSGLDWTVIRPSGLTDKPATGSWQALETSEEGVLKGTVTRGDLAAAMLAALEDPSTVGRALGVSGA